MKDTEEHIDELIVKYLSGEASPEEAIMMDEWRNQSVANERYFVTSSELLGIKLPAVDTDSLYKRIVREASIKEPKRFTLSRTQLYTRIAASVLLLSLMGLSYFILTKQSSPEKIFTAVAQPLSEQLADGSKVTLNKQSKLTLVSGFNTKQRKLKLEGEAYFEVIHDAEKPFTIETGGLVITDIGTAFNVRAHPQSDSIMVHVTEGEVNLTTPNHSLQLTATQTALYIRSKQLLRKLDYYDQNSDAYRTRAFRFRSQPVGSVLNTLNDVYDQQITVANPSLNNCLLTVDFNNESIETIVAVISETLGISYHKTQNGYVLTGNTCTQ